MKNEKPINLQCFAHCRKRRENFSYYSKLKYKGTLEKCNLIINFWRLLCLTQEVATNNPLEDDTSILSLNVTNNSLLALTFVNTRGRHQ